MSSKQCTKCGQLKALEEFHRHAKRPDGHVSQCKECVCARTRAYIAANREQVKEKQRARYAGRREEILAAYAARRDANPPVRTCECGQSFSRPPGRGGWPARCPSCRRKRELEIDARYRQRHAEQLKSKSRIRASAKRAADGGAAQNAKQRASYQRYRSAVLDHYGRQCACCGSEQKLSIDHIDGTGAAHRQQLYGSRRRGTGTTYYLWLIRSGLPDGYQTLCMRCNVSKGAGAQCRLSHDQVGTIRDKEGCHDARHTRHREGAVPHLYNQQHEPGEDHVH